MNKNFPNTHTIDKIVNKLLFLNPSIENYISIPNSTINFIEIAVKSILMMLSGKQLYIIDILINNITFDIKKNILSIINTFILNNKDPNINNPNNIIDVTIKLHDLVLNINYDYDINGFKTDFYINKYDVTDDVICVMIELLMTVFILSNVENTKLMNINDTIKKSIKLLNTQIQPIKILPVKKYLCC